MGFAADWLNPPLIEALDLGQVGAFASNDLILKGFSLTVRGKPSRGTWGRQGAGHVNPLR